MPWNYERSQRRIERHLKTVPQFDERITLAKHRQLVVEARKNGLMDQLSTRRAFVVEGAHLYGQLLDFDSVVVDSAGRETEASHRAVLRFLNMHYRIWDSIVDDNDADRVDYHGARMHAIVSDPAGGPLGQLQRAVALAAKLTLASKRVAEAYGFPARVRFGIDQGKCIAMTTGRAHDRDTLFLGSPANHAAKLAAADVQEGIFLTPSAQMTVGVGAFRKNAVGEMVLGAEFIREAVQRNPFHRIDLAAEHLISEASSDPQFVFHRQNPPLSEVDFADLSPSNSIRMSMASLFADIDGFTAFVDAAIREGSEAIKRAATRIHVIREELNDVLKEDFGGKRVRFIGDCIQGVLAQGQRDDDGAATVLQSALCAAGMKQSFSLCQEILGGIDQIDLAIGVEYGPVPLTRIGQRGDESIRCAAGRAVVVSERKQQEIEGGGVRLGPTAMSLASPAVRRHFAAASTILTYDAAVDLLGTPELPAVRIVREDPSARPYTEGG